MPEHVPKSDLYAADPSAGGLSRAYELVAADSSFVQIDMGISQREADLLADLRVDRGSAWGVVDTVDRLEPLIMQALADLGNAESENTALFSRHRREPC